MREYILHPDRFGIVTLSGLCLTVIPVLLVAGVGALAIQIAFGAIVVFSFSGMVWLTNLEARDELPGQKRESEQAGLPPSGP